MITYPLPRFEQQKSEVLQRYQILNGSNDFDTNHTARTASLVLGVPMVMAALNERYRAWFQSSEGIAPHVMERLQSFCAHAQLSDASFMVEDTRKEEYFAHEVAVTGEPNVVFFAGVPMRDPHGKRLGTFCVMDNQPRTMSTDELKIVESFAGLLSAEICLRSAGRYAVRDLIEAEEDKCTLYDLAMTDPLTTALNRRAFFRFSEKEVRRANRHGLELSVLMLDIDHFKQVNDVHGHNAGDEVLKKLIQTLVKGVREEDLIGRLGGEEFALVLPETGPATAAMLANRLRHDIKKLQFLSPAGPFNITISLGVSEPFDGDTSIQPALERADKALYEAKKNGRDRVELAPSVWNEKAQA